MSPYIFLSIYIRFISSIAQHTSITGTWQDDFWDDQSLPGWSYEDNHSINSNDPFTSGAVDYHGPYIGQSPGSISYEFTINREFTCTKDSQSIVVNYNFYGCGTGAADYVKLILDGTEYSNPGDEFQNSYNDPALTSQAPSCASEWKEFGPVGPYTKLSVNANELFTIEFVSRVTNFDEAFALSSIEITCNAEPTQQPTTNPTNQPSSQPTNQPTSSSPTTTIPTTTGPTSAPTTSSPTSTKPTTSEPTTREPTTMEPTPSPTTLSPTSTKPTTREPTTASSPSTTFPTTTSPITSQPTSSLTTINPISSQHTSSVHLTSYSTTSKPNTMTPMESSLYLTTTDVVVYSTLTNSTDIYETDVSNQQSMEIGEDTRSMNQVTIALIASTVSVFLFVIIGLIIFIKIKKKNEESQKSEETSILTIASTNPSNIQLQPVASVSGDDALNSMNSIDNNVKSVNNIQIQLQTSDNINRQNIDNSGGLDSEHESHESLYDQSHDSHESLYEIAVDPDIHHDGPGRPSTGKTSHVTLRDNDVDYEWIEIALKKCDNFEWEKYLNNFKQYKVTESELTTISMGNKLWETLIPEIGVRVQFQALCLPLV